MDTNQLQTKEPHPKVKSYSTSLKEQVRNTLISQAYDLSDARLITGIILGSILWFRLHTLNEQFIVNAWFVTLLTITVLRMGLVYLFRYRNESKKNLNMWNNLFIIGAFFGGTCWGVVPLLFFQYSDALQQLLILMIIAGITAGAVAFMSYILSSAIVFVSTTLIPLMIYFMRLLPHPDLLIAFTVFVYLISLIMQAIKYNAMLVDGLLSHFELTEAKNLVEHAATHDPLTQVSNRILFSIKFVEAIEDAKKNNKLVGLLYLDINKFKTINDTYGHSVGDKVLLIFTQRLKHLFKEKDIIARLGGDEFTIILKDIAHPEDIHSIINRIHHIMEDPFIVNNMTFNLSASIGCSIYPQDGTNPETLLFIADHEMYRIKNLSVPHSEVQPS